MDKINVQEQFQEIIRSYQNLIFSICCNMTGDYFAAEDLTQETFLAAFRHFPAFDGKDIKSSVKRQIPSDKEVFETEADASYEPETHMLEHEIRTTLLERCGKLKPPYDTVARLYFYDEKKAEEIAAEQKKNVKTVQTQIYRARAMLRKLYEKERNVYE